MTHFEISPWYWLAWPVVFVIGAVVAALAWRALRGTFDQPLFARTNHRGATVPVGAGIILFVVAVVIAGLARFIDTALSWRSTGVGSITLVALLAGGFGLLGLFDDLAASGDDRGFAGHLRALTRGRLTTGAVKLFGGGFLALVLAESTSGPISWWRLLIGAAVIALAANTANLFDRAPARCVKVVTACGVVLLATAGAAGTAGTFDRPTLTGVAMMMGAAVGLLFFDAREQLMLGDAGSNVLGAALGWGLVATTDWLAQLIVLAILVAVNIASEKVSFSAVIDRNPVLRTIDRWGRPPDDPPFDLSN